MPPRRGGPSPSTAAAAGPLAALARYALVAVACLGLTGALALPVAAQTLSDDATLSALVVNDGSDDLPLEPAFNPSPDYIDEYYVDVSHDVETVTVTATPNHSGATVEYSPSHEVSLEVGYQIIRIYVIAEDEYEEELYRVGVFRAPPATPSCTLNPGDIWCSLLPVSMNGPSGLGASEEDFSDFDFTYKTFTYRFRLIRVNSDGDFIVIFYPIGNFLTDSAAKAALRDLQLQVGSKSFRFADASPIPFYVWRNSGLQWSSGTTVTVRLRRNPTLTVRAPPGTAGLLKADWTEPTGSAYEVRYWPADEDVSMSSPFIETTAQSTLIWPLQANTEYKVSVRARTTEGWTALVGDGDGAHRGGAVGPAVAEPASA